MNESHKFVLKLNKISFDSMTISLLFRLPEDLLTCLCQEWIEMNTLAKLDNSICNFNFRLPFLSTLTNMSSKAIFNKDLILHLKGDKVHKKYLSWIDLRQIKFKNFPKFSYNTLDEIAFKNLQWENNTELNFDYNENKSPYDPAQKYCPKVILSTNGNFAKIFNSCKSLTKLSINMRSDSMFDLCSLSIFENLRHVSIDTGDGDFRTMKILSQNCKQLTSLRCPHCPVKMDSIKSIIRNNYNLIYLEFTIRFFDCRRTEQELDTMSEQLLFIMSNCTLLRHLAIYGSDLNFPAHSTNLCDAIRGITLTFQTTLKYFCLQYIFVYELLEHYDLKSCEWNKLYLARECFDDVNFTTNILNIFSSAHHIIMAGHDIVQHQQFWDIVGNQLGEQLENLSVLTMPLSAIQHLISRLCSLRSINIADAEMLDISQLKVIYPNIDWTENEIRLRI